MPDLVPGIHDLSASVVKTWMAGTSPAMTENGFGYWIERGTPHSQRGTCALYLR